LGEDRGERGARGERGEDNRRKEVRLDINESVGLIRGISVFGGEGEALALNCCRRVSSTSASTKQPPNSMFVFKVWVFNLRRLGSNAVDEYRVTAPGRRKND
jgi:hypothetical protein